VDTTASFTLVSARSYSGVVKSAVTVMDKTTTTHKTIETKWLAAQCKKK
jgi:hypothetical protein